MLAIVDPLPVYPSSCNVSMADSIESLPHPTMEVPPGGLNAAGEKTEAEHDWEATEEMRITNRVDGQTKFEVRTQCGSLGWDYVSFSFVNG